METRETLDGGKERIQPKPGPETMAEEIGFWVKAIRLDLCGIDRVPKELRSEESLIMVGVEKGSLGLKEAPAKIRADRAFMEK